MLSAEVFQLAGYNVSVRSVAGVETCVFFRGSGLNIAFDMVRGPLAAAVRCARETPAACLTLPLHSTALRRASTQGLSPERCHGVQQGVHHARSPGPLRGRAPARRTTRCVGLHAPPPPLVQRAHANVDPSLQS